MIPQSIMLPPSPPQHHHCNGDDRMVVVIMTMFSTSFHFLRSLKFYKEGRGGESKERMEEEGRGRTRQEEKCEEERGDGGEVKGG